MDGKFCIIMTTYSSGKDGRRIVEGLLKRRLAACVQEIKINSHYRWKGAAHSERETLLFIKTKSALYRKVESFIRANHSYETPEIIRVPITKGLPEYLKWMAGETKGG